MIKSYHPKTERWLRASIGEAVLLVVALLFARTAYPTITWWDSSAYSLAAATLGIESPPGSLLLTILGWPIAKLVSPTGVAHALNVLAGIVSAGTVAMVFVNAIKVLETAGSERATVRVLIGAALGGILFASTATLWDYAVRFTPYSLSAFVTTVLFFVMVAWWRCADEPHAWRWLVLLSLLFGLDFSVHRTNALLIPAALAWVLLRKPSAAFDVRTITLSVVALGVGLSAQLLIIPMAAHGGSPLNFSNPSSLSRLWDYVSLKQLGGGFLLGVFPRKSSVFGTQAADVLHILRDNFFDRGGPLGALGYAPGIAAIVGAIALVHRNARLGIALLVVVVIQFVATVVYFNIPANYFRSFDRHYLPICVIIGTLGACGVAAVLDWAMGRTSRIVGTGIAAIVCVVPVVRLAGHYHRHDASKRFFAHDWATNALLQLPRNAVYLTVGDNDTFPVMYVQAVEGVRRDVAIINTSIASQPEWRARLRSSDSTFPLSATVTVDSITPSPSFSRPIAFAVTGVAAGITGPKDSARFEGLHWLRAPASERAPNLATVRRNLFEISNYRGYADPSVDIDRTTPSMAASYYAAVMELLKMDIEKAGAPQCRTDRATFLGTVPPDRVFLPSDIREQLAAICGG